MFLLYEWNAQRQQRWARATHYVITVVALLTSVSAVLLTAAEMCDPPEDSIVSTPRIKLDARATLLLSLCCGLFPLLSAFFLSANSRFDPRAKHAALSAAAIKVRSAIYRYRSRVGEYQPSDKHALLQKLRVAGESSPAYLPRAFNSGAANAPR